MVRVLICLCLQAMVFLYDLGFPPLGHVQTGNNFMEDGECQLGGYVNNLLGYKTRLHFLSRSKDKVDVVMFGESKCRVRSNLKWNLSGLLMQELIYLIIHSCLYIHSVSLLIHQTVPTSHSEPASTRCGFGPVCVPIELLSTYFNLPQPCVVLVQCVSPLSYCQPTSTCLSPVWCWSSVCPHRATLNLLQPASTQCGVGPVSVPMELFSTYFNLPQPSVLLV